MSSETEDFDRLDNLVTAAGRPDQGELLADRFRVLRRLGEGGMGMVYLAEDTELGDEKIAIKFIPPVLAGSPSAIKSLRREAQLARQLSHPNIVRLHDLHTDGSQRFLVMEYVEGMTLEALLAEDDQGCMSLDELIPVALQMASALDYAHGMKILHRDLKPSNIMLCENGALKILDFGIARQLKDSYARVTGQDTSGTLPYMSPEQLMGETPTVAMDIYSFGAVLYECLSGHPPFYRGDIRSQILAKEPGAIRGLPEKANDVLRGILSKEAASRPKLAADALQLLRLAVAFRQEPNLTEQSGPSVPPFDDNATGKILEVESPAAVKPAVRNDKCELCGSSLDAARFCCKRCRAVCCSTCWNSTWALCSRCANAIEFSRSKNKNDVRERVLSETLRRLVKVPSGKFLWGRKRKEVVAVEFWISATAVTCGEYATFLKSSGYKPSGTVLHLLGRSKADHPVGGVSYADAAAYAEWLGLILPDEVQWEKAARGTDGREYPWGDEFETDRANTLEAAAGECVSVLSMPRGRSPFGCYHTAGNVWEWTTSYYDAGRRERVIKGGSYRDNRSLCACCYREGLEEGFSKPDLGFRCAKTSKEA